MVLTAYFVISPGNRAFLPPSPARLFEFKKRRELSASVGAPGPHDFAVRAGTARLKRTFFPHARCHRVHRSPHSTYRDDAYAPLHEAGWLKGRHHLVQRRSGIFFARDLDG